MQTLALFGNIGHWELLIIGGVLLLLFGRRLPEVGRSLGQGIVQFKRGLRDIEDEVDRNADAPAETARAPLSDGRDQRVAQSPMTAGEAKPDASGA